MSRWSALTPRLAFSAFCLLVGDMLFGYDTASFGGLLANPGFISTFGSVGANGAYAFTATTTSLLASLAFIGKFVGCWAAGPVIERWGHRQCFVILSIISLIGITIEMASSGLNPGSGRVAQFIVGRIIVYISVGLVEVCVTTYQAEIMPAPLRGFAVVSLQLFLNAGALLATGVNKALSTSTTTAGWRIVTAVQYVFAISLICLAPTLPNSPRWLLSKDRYDDAVRSMKMLRTQAENDDGRSEAEVQTIQQSLQVRVHKGKWIDMVKGTNLRRTMLVMVAYTYQQITGQAFTSTYQVVFYRQNGYAAQAFTYPIIGSVLAMAAVLPGMVLVDSLGRRPVLLISNAGQMLFLFLLGGLGSKQGRSTTENGALVAFFMLFSVSYCLGGASIPYLIGAEIPNAAVREKTDAIGAAWNVLWALITNLVLPYMLAALNFKVGLIFGAIAASAVAFYWAFLPETKNKKLEEIDALFETPFNPFKPNKAYQRAAEITAARLEAARLAEVEAQHEDRRDDEVEKI